MKQYQLVYTIGIHFYLQLQVVVYNKKSSSISLYIFSSSEYLSTSKNIGVFLHLLLKNYVCFEDML